MEVLLKVKRLIVFLSVSLTIIFMSACGSTTNDPEQSEEPQTENEVNELDEESEMKDDDEIVPKNDEGSEEDKKEPQPNSLENDDSATLTKSDNQDFSLYLLDGYELTGEEPRKDVLYFKDEDHYFTRIELLPVDHNLDDATDTIKAQLEAVSPDVTKGEAPAGHDWLNDATIYTSHNNEDRVNAYLIPKDKFLLKLTIFTDVDDDHVDPFLRMAETIDSN